MTEVARLLAVVFALLVSGCGQAPSQTETAAAAANVAMPARVTIGDLEVSGSVVPTAALGDAVARRYRIEPSRGRALVLVRVQRDDAVLPARVTGDVRDLRGVRQVLEFDAVEVDGATEYVATARVSGPDTLRLALQVVTEAGERVRLDFSRDIPR